MFPMKHVEVIKTLNYIKLEEQNIHIATSGEILKFFGVLILFERFIVPKCIYFWKKTA